MTNQTALADYTISHLHKKWTNTTLSVHEIVDIAYLLSNVGDDNDLAALTFLSTTYDDIATITATIIDLPVLDL